METPAATNNPFRPGNGLSDGIVEHAAVNMHGTINKVSASANEAVSAAKPVIARVAQAAHQAVDTVTDVATPTAAWLSAQSESLASTQRKAVAHARTHVLENPWQSLGVALAAGFLIGRWSR